MTSNPQSPTEKGHLTTKKWKMVGPSGQEKEFALGLRQNSLAIGSKATCKVERFSKALCNC